MAMLHSTFDPGLVGRLRMRELKFIITYYPHGTLLCNSEFFGSDFRVCTPCVLDPQMYKFPQVYKTSLKCIKINHNCINHPQMYKN